jgi:hypothetical protein
MDIAVSQDCAYVHQHYRVPAEIGRRVIANGEPGVLLTDRGHYIGVVLDSDPRNASAITTQPGRCSTAIWPKSCCSSSTVCVSTAGARAGGISRIEPSSRS